MSEARVVGESSVLADLVSLTKPRVISLLLVTTIAAPMFATRRGLPPWPLVVVVAFASYLIQHFLPRRTR